MESVQHIYSIRDVQSSLLHPAVSRGFEVKTILHVGGPVPTSFIPPVIMEVLLHIEAVD